MTADDATVAAFEAHDDAGLKAEVKRRVVHVQDCVASHARGFTKCGLQNCGGRADRLCGGAVTLLPTKPWRQTFPW